MGNPWERQALAWLRGGESQAGVWRYREGRRTRPLAPLAFVPVHLNQDGPHLTQVCSHSELTKEDCEHTE